MSLTRRGLLLAAGAVAGGAAARWTMSKGPSMDGLGVITPKGGEGVLNDASLLSETPIFRHSVLKDRGEALVTALRVEMEEARVAGRTFNIGAARHSMGGQAIPAGGHAVTLDSPQIEIDSAAKTYRVQAGDALTRRYALTANARPSESTSPSLPCGPAICRFTGIPSASCPHGSDRAGVPSMLLSGV